MKKIAVIAAGLAGLGVAGMAMANEPYFPRGERGFQRMDANKDGKLSLQEISPVMDKRLITADSNGDKIVTAAEIDAMLTKRIEARRTRMMQLLDANKDGSITVAEMDSVVENMLNNADANKDGGVDMAELKSFKRGQWRKAFLQGTPPQTPN